MSNPPTLIATSPLNRAIQTSLIAFESLIGKASFVAHEMIREESGVHICDKRLPVSHHKAEYPQVDFSLMMAKEEDPIFSETQRESKEQVGERIYLFMEWLSNRKEADIAIASHSGWLQTVFNGIVECEGDLKKWFMTGEMRSVRLEFIAKDEED